ncbi:uncharacterized protein J3R85_003921 [Psidium guajava]|nr:uncharacterized protein J3R85_003921 [Psidium guajava]
MCMAYITFCFLINCFIKLGQLHSQHIGMLSELGRNQNHQIQAKYEKGLALLLG